jgi:NAD-dependent SIR2 family protein deacetylase
MAIKYFECEHCDSHGKITVKDEDISTSDIVYCPVCGGDIYEDDDDEN